MRAGLRPPLKLDVRFSRIQLSRRRSSARRDGRDQATGSPARTRRRACRSGSRFQPQQRHRLNRCDQMRRTIQTIEPVEELADVGLAVWPHPRMTGLISSISSGCSPGPSAGSAGGSDP